MERSAIHAKLVERFGDAVLALEESGLDPHCDVQPQRLGEIARFLRDDPELDFDQLMCLSGVDYDGLDLEGKGKSVDILGYTEDGRPETSDRVAEGDLGVVYHLFSHARRHKFTLRARVPRDVAAVPTVNHLWTTAEWHEREAWDLVGIRFTGHADLRRILLDDDWEGHPLRKDYQMPDAWQGVPLAGRPLSVDRRPRPPVPDGGTSGGAAAGEAGTTGKDEG
ncbi:MAG: NADH-quinone oxidoreductase subunit C [Candidatus Krumholzibacteriia bacterium]